MAPLCIYNSRQAQPASEPERWMNLKRPAVAARFLTVLPF